MVPPPTPSFWEPHSQSRGGAPAGQSPAPVAEAGLHSDLLPS
jgi:hypothetical protein